MIETSFNDPDLRQAVADQDIGLANVKFNRLHTVLRNDMLIEKDADYERYKRLRAVSRKLNSELAHLLRKKDINRCGKDLGILRKNTLVFDHEDDLGSLMEYCIHNPAGKKSCIDLYIEQSLFDPVSDEMMLLNALRESFFSIFQVKGTEKGYLCYGEDILRQKEIILIDVGFGSTARPGIVIAARLMKMPASDYYMTTGAPIVVQEEQGIDLIEVVLRKFSQPIESGNLSQTQANSIGKQVIRSLLRVRSENTILADPEENEQALSMPNIQG